MESTQAVKALGALAQESRLAIFRLLVQAGPAGMVAGHLSGQVGLSPSALSFHMKELMYSGLATSRQEGRFVIYSAQLEAMNDLLGYLTQNCCGGAPCPPVGTMTCQTTTSATAGQPAKKATQSAKRARPAPKKATVA